MDYQLLASLENEKKYLLILFFNLDDQCKLIAQEYLNELKDFVKCGTDPLAILKASPWHYGFDSKESLIRGDAVGRMFHLEKQFRTIPDCQITEDHTFYELINNYIDNRVTYYVTESMEDSPIKKTLLEELNFSCYLMKKLVEGKLATL